MAIIGNIPYFQTNTYVIFWVHLIFFHSAWPLDRFVGSKMLMMAPYFGSINVVIVRFSRTPYRNPCFRLISWVGLHKCNPNQTLITPTFGFGIIPEFLRVKSTFWLKSKCFPWSSTIMPEHWNPLKFLISRKVGWFYLLNLQCFPFSLKNIW